MKRILLLLLAAAVTTLSGALRAQTTQKLTANKLNEYGLIYSLPRTAIDITVVTERTVSSPGEFSNYANRYLGLTDAVRTPGETVKVTKVILNTRGIPDAANRWTVQFKSGSSASMLLTDAGIPLAVNADNVTMPEGAPLPQAVPAPVSPLETDAARQAVTLEMTRSTSLSKKAELTAQRIFEMREQRNDLISGNSDNMPADAGALSVALDALNAQEAALTAMFAGTTLTSTDVNTFTVIPGAEVVSDSIVARISPADGLVDADDLRGIPLTLTVKVLSRGELPRNEKDEIKKFPKGGLAYVIPGTAELSVAFNGREVATATVELAQLGCTFGIDPGLFTDRKAPMQAIFSPVTGAITSLEPVESKAE